MSSSDLNISRWLEAHCDRSAGLITLPRSAVFADIAGDRDYRLILTDLKLEPDMRSRLKIYKGTVLTPDVPLPDIPNSVVSFYVDDLEPLVAVVGVACGTDLLVYKNGKPFFKFTLPARGALPLETEVWRKIFEEKDDLQKLVDELRSVPFSALSARSQRLVSLPVDQYEHFVAGFHEAEPVKTTVITCMTTLPKSTPSETSVSCPVLGTEAGDVYVVDPQTFKVLHHASACNTTATPFVMRAVGAYDVQFSVVVACRERSVCLLRRDWLEGKALIQFSDDIVDLVILPGDQFIVVATTNCQLHCHTKRGQRLWTANLANPVTCLCVVALVHLSVSLVAVGLRGGFVHLYHGRHPVDHISVPDAPSCLVFGQLGQEEHVLVVVTLGGTINFKILKRTADFNLSSQDKIPSPSLQSKPLPLPKRSKLFLEQSARERKNPTEMHRNFQQDMVRLRLRAAQALAETLTNQTITGNDVEQVKLTAQVLGLGPKFTLILNLENINNEKAIFNYSIVFHSQPTNYIFSNNIVRIPLIPPGLSYKIEAKVTEIIENNQYSLDTGKSIKVFVIKKEQCQPILAATINMPPTEAPEFL